MRKVKGVQYMKKRLFSLLLAVCMLFCVSSVAFAYDYSADGSYQVEYRINDNGYKTLGYLWVPCGKTVTVEYKWTTSPAYPYEYAWVLHVNGVKVPSRGLNQYGWQYASPSLEEATGIEGLTGFDIVPAQYAVIRNGKPNPLSVDYTAPATGNGSAIKYFSLRQLSSTFQVHFEDESGNRVDSLSYSYRPTTYGEFTLDADDVQAYLAENGYELVPPEQSHTVNYTVDASGNDVFEPSEVVFIVRPIQEEPEPAELQVNFVDQEGTLVEELSYTYTTEEEKTMTFNAESMYEYLAEKGYLLWPMDQAATVSYTSADGFSPSEVTFKVMQVSSKTFS